jgi:hypothetical protein
MVKAMTNTQKKILAGVLTITFPVWLIVVVPLLVVFMMFALIYTSIADAMGVSMYDDNGKKIKKHFGVE